MKREKLIIGNIPAILWGDKSDKLFIAVHGNMSHKADDVVVIFAEEAVKLGFQVLSFDLPKHGERKKECTLCKVQHCVQDLDAVMHYAKSFSNSISVFACSIGAYFSLLAYKNQGLQQSLFLSPVVNMESIIINLMQWFGITENRLMNEKEVATPIGEVLYWDYYCYVKENPVVEWKVPTSILYGSEDNLCDYNIVSSFSKQFDCNFKILKNGDHYFHTEEQLSFFRLWAKERLLTNLNESRT
ncbi:alpha/beta hydrolase [Vibrio aestuarianus]|uniref:alpha/beta hydrolase n=1 Tax=Vibrio aestuarianus TaxID=28171 RepID=UPI004069050C